jgi:hypothetical protein
VLLAAGIRWHFAAGPPFYEGSIGLLIAFAMIAALVGLVSIWASFAAVHWSTRASGLIAGAALMAGLATLFFDWNNFLIWQLIVLIFAEMACVIAVFGAFRLCGYTIRPELAESEQRNAAAVTISCPRFAADDHGIGAVFLRFALRAAGELQS